MVTLRLRCPAGLCISIAVFVCVGKRTVCDRYEDRKEAGKLRPDPVAKGTGTVLGTTSDTEQDGRAVANATRNPVAAVVGAAAVPETVVAASSPVVKYIPSTPLREVETTLAEPPLIQHLNMLKWSIAGYFGAIVFVTVLWFTVVYRDGTHRESPTDRSGKYKSRLSIPTQDSPSGTAGADRFTQNGYCKTWLGSIVWLGWVGLFLLTQVELGCLVYMFVYADKSDEDAVIQMFMLIFYISAFLPILGIGFVHEHWFMATCSLAEATHILLQEEDFEPRALRGPATLKRTLAKVESSPDDPSERWFTYTCIVFFWDTTMYKFRPSGSVSLFAHRLPKEGLDSKTAAGLLKKCRNVIDVAVPSIPQSLFTEFCNPIWLYQMYCCWLALFWSAWLESGIFASLSLIAGTSQALMVHQQQTKVQEMVSLSCDVEVCRDGKWLTLQSSELVPKDLLRPQPGPVPCDCLLLSGQAVVNESMLTGEPMPVAKSPFSPSDTEAVVNPQAVKKNMLFAGTDLIQTDGATCIATATGAMTSKGQLVRMVLFPSPVHFKFVRDLPWALLTVIIYDMFCMAVLMVGGPPTGELNILMGTYTIVQSFSPLIFISFVAGQSAAAKRIEAKGMRCLAPARCQVAGKVHLVVFDKTGTLTESGMSIVGVQPADAEGFAEKQILTGRGSQYGSLMHAGPLWSAAFATCHSLAKVGELWVGPSIEAQMLEASGWKLLPGEQRTFTAPSIAGPHGRASGDKAEVLRVLDFDHHRTTSGALVRMSFAGSSESRTVLFVKGSYEKIASFCPVSSTYDAVTNGLAARGFYVLSLAYREVPPAEVAHLVSAPRGKLETGLSLLGLLLFKNELKADTKDALSELHGGAIRSIMCTGDNVFTGANIARQCGILEQDDLLIFCDMRDGVTVWYTREPDGEVLDVSLEDVIYKDAKFAVTGAAYRELDRNGHLDKLLPRICVFGRMNPEQKRDLVIRYQEHSLIVGMCGDGGNDCAALRAAHVGVALSESEASIVAPFSSGPTKSVKCVVHVAKVGRACLATNLASYKFCLVSGLFFTSCKVLMLVWFRSVFAEWQYVVIGILILPGMNFGITGCCVEREKLAPHRQQSSLFAILMTRISRISKRLKLFWVLRCRTSCL